MRPANGGACHGTRVAGCPRPARWLGTQSARPSPWRLRAPVPPPKQPGGGTTTMRPAKGGACRGDRVAGCPRPARWLGTQSARPSPWRLRAPVPPPNCRGGTTTMRPAKGGACRGDRAAGCPRPARWLGTQSARPSPWRLRAPVPPPNCRGGTTTMRPANGGACHGTRVAGCPRPARWLGTQSAKADFPRFQRRVSTRRIGPPQRSQLHTRRCLPRRTDAAAAVREGGLWAVVAAIPIAWRIPTPGSSARWTSGRFPTPGSSARWTSGRFPTPGSSMRWTSGRFPTPGSAAPWIA